MKKVLSFILYFFFISNALFAQNTIVQFSMIQVESKNANRQQLAALGIEVDHAITTNNATQFVASDYDLNVLAQNNITCTILQKDLAAYYRDRLALGATSNSLRSSACNGVVAPNYNDPSFFSFGSMGGYYTYEEAFQVMDSLAAKFPNIIKPKATIGNFLTFENRSLYWYKISDNPNVDEAEPEILFNALHHAREAITLSQTIYFMAYLCENYATNPEIKFMVDNAEIYFIPIINPDGYKYNQNTFPNGGGMWRKNRRNNGSDFGVDLNRNYSLGWGVNNTGSSGNTNSNTYRGPAPASEPEVQAVQSFVNSHNFKIAQSSHSFGNLWVYPWGYLSANCDDSVQFRAMAAELTKHNSYKAGIDQETVGYSTNGSSDDWLYGDPSHGKILCGTPESGEATDGFWPLQNRILPLCREMNYFNLTSVKFLLSHASVQDLSDRLIGGTQQSLPFELNNLGLSPNASFTLSLVPISNNIVNVSVPKVFTNLAIQAKVVDSFSYQMASATANNALVKFALELDNGYVKKVDTLVKYFGNKVVLFNDDCSTMNNWSSTMWNTASPGFNSASCLSDSPFGNYDPSTFSEITLKNFISMTNIVRAELRYRVKFSTENNLDFVAVQAVTNAGPQDLCGQYTQIYSSANNSGDEAYNGIITDWKYESINLDPLVAANQIKLQWALQSDAGLEMDGIQIDDIRVSALTKNPESISSIGDKQTFCYPNPTNGNIYVPDNVQLLAVVNSQGQSIPFQIQDQMVELKVPGLYQFKLKSKQKETVFFEKVIMY